MGQSPEPHDPYAALRFPDYRRFWIGSILASAGFGMQFLAVEWELYERTNSALMLGYVGLIQFLPVLLLSIPAGHIADRVSRKWMFVGSQSLMALASVGLTVLSLVQGHVALIYLCLMLVGV